jgi:hypothetical protein
MAAGPRMGGDQLGALSCVDEDSLITWSIDVAEYINNFVLGVDDHLVFGDVGDTTPATLAEKIENPSTYDSGAHQLVYRETVDVGGVLTQQLFTDKGVGAGDNFTFKIDAASTAGFLDAKIHADSWVTAAEIAGTPAMEYGVGDFFPVYVADTASDTAIVYAPYKILKNSAGDAAPEYHFAKHANHSTYVEADHVLILCDDTGPTVRSFVSKADIFALVEILLALGAYVQLVAITGEIAAAIWSSATGKLTPTACEFPVLFEHPDEDGTLTFHVGTTIEFTANYPTLIAAPATGNFYFGLVIGGKLVTICCEEQELHADWDA